MESNSGQKRWDKYFLDICNIIGSNSKCLSRQIGAILVKDNSIITTGYNGPARGIPHCGGDRIKLDHALRSKMLPPYCEATPMISCPRKSMGFKSGEGLQWCIAAHAEANCIANAARHGVCTKNSVMYMNDQTPCKDCMAIIINAGIIEVIVTKNEGYDVLGQFIAEQAYLVVRTYQEDIL